MIEDYDRYMKSTRDDKVVKLHLQYSFDRKAPAGKEHATGRETYNIPMSDFKPFIEIISREAGSVTEGDATEASITIDDALPKILHLGTTSSVEQIALNPESRGDPLTSFKLTLVKPTKGVHRNLNWRFNIDPSKLQKPFKKEQGTSDSNDAVIVVYSDGVIDGMFASALSMSVISLYITVVYTIGKVVRTVFERFSEHVIYEELPDTEKLREILEGIGIAQLKGDLRTEKELYDLFMLVYRSP
jgi:hypothetical protein